VEIEGKKADDAYILSLKGRLDAYSSNELEKIINKLIDKGTTKIVVNFEEVVYISSSGLRVMLASLKRLKRVGGEIKLAALKPYVQEVFDISGFTQLFEIYDEEEDAVNSFN